MAFPAGHALTADELNSALPIPPAVKTADESISGTTLQNDDHLFVLAVPNTRYLLELEGAQNSPGAGDMKIVLSVPSGATGTLCGLDGAIPFADVSLTGTLVFGGVGAAEYLRVFGQMVTSSAGGLVRVTWAQNASSGSSSLLEGTTLRLTKAS